MVPPTWWGMEGMGIVKRGVGEAIVVTGDRSDHWLMVSELDLGKVRLRLSAMMYNETRDAQVCSRSS